MGHYDDLFEEDRAREAARHAETRRVRMIEKRKSLAKKLDTLSDEDMLFVEQIALDAASYRAFFKILSNGGPKL